MCLCTQNTNGINLVCCNCKYSRKGIRTSQKQLEKCPKCQNELIDIGSKIEIPKKRDKKGWNKLNELIQTNEYFSVCQC